jgi:hypothetical protein
MKHLQLLLAATAVFSPSASAQQVMWKSNPITGKVVGLTYGTSSWTAAEAQAVAYGGHLVTIRSEAENQWLYDNFRADWMVSTPQGPYGPWIGMNDIAVEGQWTWASGEPVIYGQPSVQPGPWGSSQPDNNGGSEDTAHFYFPAEDAKWNDTGVAFPYRALVEVVQRPARTWSWPRIIANLPAIVLAAGDVDADGRLDIVAADRVTQMVRFWRGEVGGFVLAQTISYEASTIALLDLGGDGDLDLAMTRSVLYSTEQVRLATFSGGQFHLELTGLPLDSPTQLAAADMNADGRMDLVGTADDPSDYVRIWLQTPNGQLLHHQTISSGSDRTYGVEVLEVNGDQLPDLAIKGGWSGDLAIFKGIGGGTVQLHSRTQVGTGINDFRAMAVADFNGDGRDDVAVGLFFTGAAKVFLAGIDTMIPSATIPYPAALLLRAGDWDHDGTPDLAVFSGSPSMVARIFYGNSGAFVAGPDLAVGTGVGEVAVSDTNSDGRVELVCASGAGLVLLEEWATDCNGNGIDDFIDLNSGFAQDCNGNGRPDSCDLALGVSQDSNGNGFLDECEPTLVAMAPAVRPAFQAGVVTVSTTNIPDGVATLTLSSAGLAAPVVATVSIVNNSGTVTLPALGAASASDVVAAGTLSFTDALGNTVVTAATPGVFTWDVPEIVEAVPANAPFDVATGVVFRLEDHVATSGFGTATFGAAAPQGAFLFSAGGQTWVSTTAPAQAAPGPVSVLLQFGSEFTLEQRGFVYLGPGITSLSATEGWQAGGEALEVGLFGFAPGAPVEVRLGSGAQFVTATGVATGVSSGSRVSVTTPQQLASGALDLEVVQFAGQAGEKRASSPGAWLAKAPAVLGVNPASAYQGGGETLVVALAGLEPGQATQVRLGPQVHVVTNVGTLAASTATVTSQLWTSPGPVTVSARQKVGAPDEIGASLAAALDVVGPTLASLLPTSGPLEGGTVVVAQTSGFDPSQSAQVQLGGTTLVGTVAGSGAGQTVTFRTTRASASGATDVTISQGVLVATLTSGFTFDAARVTNFCQAKLTSAGTLPVIGFSGSPSLSTGDFAITLSNALPDKYCLYFFGESPLTNTPFYGGKLCVAGNIKRGPTVLTNANSFVSCPFPVTPALVGQNRYFQWWFRDPADPFSVGLTGGLRVLGFYP